MSPLPRQGVHMGVRWTIQEGVPGCSAPLVTAVDSEGVFAQQEMPNATPQRAEDLIDAELLRRAAMKRGKR